MKKEILLVSEQIDYVCLILLCCISCIIAEKPPQIDYFRYLTEVVVSACDFYGDHQICNFYDKLYDSKCIDIFFWKLLFPLECSETTWLLLGVASS